MSEVAYRAYCFGNFYLSSIQQGIQAFHAGVAMSLRYMNTVAVRILKQEQQAEIFKEWAEAHQTAILLNGGDCSDLQELSRFLGSEENPYPRDTFEESNDALNEAITCVIIVLPDKFWLKSTTMEPQLVLDGVLSPTGFTAWELDLLRRMSKCPLAR